MSAESDFKKRADAQTNKEKLARVEEEQTFEEKVILVQAKHINPILHCCNDTVDMSWQTVPCLFTPQYQGQCEVCKRIWSIVPVG